jgi:O-antigen/teichoic acid export membrane protein
MSLKKDLVKVGSVNILVFVSGMLNAFIIPKYLTVLAYSSYKTYLLYIGFIGILHFGFVDGINLYFGGKKKESINKNEVQALFFFILIIELLVCFLLFIIYLIAGSGVILLYLIISIIPLNLNSFLLFYYQAIGDFNSYTKTMLILPITNIVGITFIVAFNLADYHLFIYLYIISYLLSVIYSISINTKITRGHNVISNIKYIINNIFTIRKIIVSGFYLLIGNLLYLLFFDIGRVLIKFLGTEVNFAMYSFSLSMMSAVIIFVNSINKTIYPYMFNYSNSQRGKLTEYLTMLGVASFPLYYGVYYLVLNYIPKYEDALLLTAILMSSIPGILIVKSIYVNQYKVIKLERLFVKDTLIYLSICLPLVR